MDYKLISGDDKKETDGRYRLEWCENDKKQSDATENKIKPVVPNTYWAAVKNALNNGSKVLWVCNTVADSVRIYDEAKKLSGDGRRILFHSRFCYRHRVDRQNEILTAFGKDKPPCLAVTTQVCEMSLDISAGLLVTALPPFPALVQRMGRLNRRLENPDGAPCLVYDYDGMDGRPYRRADLKRPAMSSGNSPMNAGALATRSQGRSGRDPGSGWTTSSSILLGSTAGGKAKQASLREGDATVPVMLAQHEDDIRKRIKEIGKSIAVKEWLVPILQDKKGIRVLRKINGYPLVSGVEYDEEKGVR